MCNLLALLIVLLSKRLELTTYLHLILGKCSHVARITLARMAQANIINHHQLYSSSFRARDLKYSTPVTSQTILLISIYLLYKHIYTI